MKVAITGGTGFVGRYVVKELLDLGLEVLILTTSPERVLQFHWCDKVNVIKADINFIFPFIDVYRVFGDYSGTSRSTRRRSTDYDIIRNTLNIKQENIFVIHRLFSF